MWYLLRVRKLLFLLRIEEAVALAFLVPTTYLTLTANAYVLRHGLALAQYPAAVTRLSAAAGFLVVLFGLHRRWPQSAWVRGIREGLPFLVCLLIYTNLHDTIGFVNPHDIHGTLIAFDEWLLGGQPALWAEPWISRGLTEVMNVLYWNFVWIAGSNSLLLLLAGRLREFRSVTFGIVTCFYLGYVLYILFPAAPPRLVLASQFKTHLFGYTMGLTSLSDGAFGLLPVDSRGAFPSLHAAVSLMALIYAWRHLRGWFWVLLPATLGLWASTLYLRHHYVVDLLAGFLLAPLALWLAPRLDRFWAERQRSLGYRPALGASAEAPTAWSPGPSDLIVEHH